MKNDCTFCSIVAGEQEADLVYEGEEVVAFHDVNPQAPIHILLIPREHVSTVNELEESHAEVVGKLFLKARDLAQKQGIDEDGYRLVMNTNRQAGQSVFHIHLHLLGGRQLQWPPG